MNFTSEFKFLPYAFLDLIHIGPDQFRNDLKEFAPIISPQVDSFKTNPACDCRNKIIEYIEANRGDSFSFLTNWFSTNKELYGYLENVISSEILEQKYLVNEVQGKIFEINDTPEDFMAFKEKMDLERFVFRSIHLFKDNNKLKIYFL